MPQSLSNVLIHVVFSTKNRLPFIQADIEDELYAYLATACRTKTCPALKIGGTEDHVHLLCSLSRTTAIADLLSEIKADSSKWIKTKGKRHNKFAWQNGYGVFSIGQSQIKAVRQYIYGQKEHHRCLTFQEEYRAILKRYKIEYDERYVWD